MKTSILAGREFAPDERLRDVCVVNQSAANALFPRQSAIGRYVQTRDPLMGQRGPAAAGPGLDAGAPTFTCRVIGVATDAKFASLREPPPRTIYYPMVAELADQNLGLSDQCPDEERRGIGLPRGAAGDRAVDPAGAVLHAARADGCGARQPARRSRC